MPDSPFSAVRFAEELSRIRGIFRVFWDMRQAEVTSVKTVWRRERDSNPQYLFEFVSADVVVTCSERRSYQRITP